jgi:hypothetical protein
MTVEDVYHHVQGLSAADQERLVELIEDNLGEVRRNLIRDNAQLEEMLVAGLRSGPGIEATPAYWAAKERRAVERLGPA